VSWGESGRLERIGLVTAPAQVLAAQARKPRELPMLTQANLAPQGDAAR